MERHNGSIIFNIVGRTTSVMTEGTINFVINLEFLFFSTMNSFNGINVVGVTTTCATEGTTSGAEQLIPDEMFYYLLGVMILLCLYKVRCLFWKEKKLNSFSSYKKGNTVNYAYNEVQGTGDFASL